MEGSGSGSVHLRIQEAQKLTDPEPEHVILLRLSLVQDEPLFPPQGSEKAVRFFVPGTARSGMWLQMYCSRRYFFFSF